MPAQSFGEGVSDVFGLEPLFSNKRSKSLVLRVTIIALAIEEIAKFDKDLPRPGELLAACIVTSDLLGFSSFIAERYSRL